MVEIICIVTLALLVIAQAVERYFFAKHMTNELSKSVKAVMSRNINEFISATQADKPVKEGFTQNDEVDLGLASEEEFDKFIKSQIQE